MKIPLDDPMKCLIPPDMGNELVLSLIMQELIELFVRHTH